MLEWIRPESEGSLKYDRKIAGRVDKSNFCVDCMNIILQDAILIIPLCNC